jgi:hypothetical protein
MKTCFIGLLLLLSSHVYTQQVKYNHVFVARNLKNPPVYPYGVDSCIRFYFANFAGFDSLLTKVIAMGDTAKYIRVCFSFVIADDGSPYDPQFLAIGSTQYSKSAGMRLLKYFDADKKYYEGLIKQMIAKMTFWKPGLYNGIPVNSRVDDYLQFWVGINPPAN